MATSARSMFCLLDVAGMLCALPRSAVREILPLPHLYPPPAAGGPLAGFLDLGGRPIPVLDLARLLGLRGEPREGDPYRHVLLAADGDVALLVDRVVDVVEAASDAVRPVDGRHTLNGCVETEIAIGDRLVHGLSLERMLTAEERERVAALTRQAAERLAAFEATPAA